MTGLKRLVFAARGTGRGRAGIEGRWRRRVGGPRFKVPSGPIRSRTPPAGQGRRRRGLPGPFQERRGPAPETGRGRGQAGPAPQAAARGQKSCAPPPPGPTRGVARVAAAVAARRELRAWAPRGPGRTLRRTHRGRAKGGKDACERSSERGDRFLPRPTPQAAAAAAAVVAAAAATPAPESAAAVAAAPLPLRSPLPLRPEPRPAPAPAPHWASGARGCPGRPRGALTEGEGRRAEARTLRTGSEEGAGGGRRKWGRGAERGSGRRGGGAGAGRGGSVGTGGTGRGEGLGGPEPPVLRSQLGLGNPAGPIPQTPGSSVPSPAKKESPPSRRLRSIPFGCVLWEYWT